MKTFVTVAHHEVALLQESDDHAHVIRYYCHEQRDDFLYIALELCPASLADLIDNENAFADLANMLEPKRALRQITSGLAHLHKLSIVHRDIKPQNILVAPARGKAGAALGATGSGLRMLISDFGLCKKLELDQNSWAPSTANPAGSFGYRAPEILRGEVDLSETVPEAGTSTNSTGSSTDSTVSGGNGNGKAAGARRAVGGKGKGRARLTRSIDIFALGCVFYYVLTRGDHPFGIKFEREMNVLKGQTSVEGLECMGDEAFEAQDLILRMVEAEPQRR
jgi:serine/threonine-protein kinase/endoribonuclease IRE1